MAAGIHQPKSASVDLLDIRRNPKTLPSVPNRKGRKSSDVASHRCDATSRSREGSTNGSLRVRRPILPAVPACLHRRRGVGGWLRCSAPKLSSSSTASGLTSAAISDSEHSPVRLAAVEQSSPDQSESLPAPPLASQPIPTADAEEISDLPAGQPLPLPDAIALAFQRQPRLRVFLEGIQQAAGRNDIAFAPFLPTLSTGYTVGGL